MQTFYIVHSDKVAVLEYYRSETNAGQLLRLTPLEAWRAMVDHVQLSLHRIDSNTLRLFRVMITPSRASSGSYVWTDEAIPTEGLLGVSFDAMPIGVNPPPHGTKWDISMETLEEAMEPNEEADTWVPFAVVTLAEWQPESIDIEEVKF
jgi:hypothetical protein